MSDTEVAAREVLTAAPLDIEAIIRELDEAELVPEGAIRACQANRELMTPRLIQVIADATAEGRQGIVHEGAAPVIALLSC